MALLNKFRMINEKSLHSFGTICLPRVAVVIFLGYLLAGSSCKNCKDVDVPYVESIPYEATESYSEEARFDSESAIAREYDCLKMNFWNTRCLEQQWYLNVVTTIKNLEEVPVSFEVTVFFDSDYEGKTSRKQKVRLEGLQTETISTRYYLQNEFADYRKPSYQVEAGMIEKERKVTKYESTTKYRRCNTCVEDCEKILQGY